jgi:mannose/fructose/N-acetylgalactosamine-specific phosphotransferase system component IIC
MKEALLIALTYWIIQIANDSGASSFGFFRPIFTAPVTGLLLGDFKTGLILGAELEAIYMGIVGFGGSSPADATSAAVICTAYVIIGGMDMEAAIAFALPIGTVLAEANQLATLLAAYVVPKFDKYAASGDTVRFKRLHIWYRVLVSKSIHTILIFFAVLLGATRIQGLLDILPAFIMHGLTVAGNLLPAVGLGILCAMTFNKRYGPWLFVGFAMAAYLGLGNMGVAIFAGAAAVLTYFSETKNTVSSPQTAETAAPVKKTEQEDFFNE